jgi:iron complex outermembrane receptor protein
MTHRNSRLSRAIASSTVAGAVLLALGAPVSSAQGAPQAEAGLEEVVVSARKRAESIVEVPLAVTALSAEALQERGVRGFNELNDFVPGLRYENSAANRNDRGFHTIAMRGMYPGDSPNRQAVTVFLDGVPIPGGAIPGLTGVEQVEVVKGPQSAYFGRSTFAGAINFVTRAPQEEFSGRVAASYASFETIELDAEAEGRLGVDWLTGRVTLRHYKTAGAWNNQFFGGKLGSRETNAVTVSLMAKPTDTLTLRAFYAGWTDSDGPSAQAALTEADYNCNAGGTGRLINGRNYVCGSIGNTPAARMAQNTLLTGTAGFATMVGGSTIQPPDFIDHMGLEREAYQSTLSANWELGSHDVAALFGRSSNQWGAMTETYNRPDASYHRLVYLPYDFTNSSAELRLSSSGDDRLQYMVGGNYYEESIKFGSRALTNGVVSQLGAPANYMAETLGLFGSVSYDLTDTLNLSAEARYQEDTIHHVIVGGADLEDTFTSFSPRVIARYDINEDVNVYVSAARGTRPGVFNSTYTGLSQFAQDQIRAQVNVPVSVPEEILTSYEVGIKGDFLDRRLRLLTALYYGKWIDRQINQNIPYRATPTATTVSTATITFPIGKVDLWGLELEGSLQATDRLSFDFMLNWAATDIGFTDCSECVAIDGIRNPAGNLMERYPEFAGALGAMYEWPMAGDRTGFLRGDYTYTGRQYATAANEAWTAASNRINLRAGIRTERYTFEVFGRNVTDDDVPSNILRNANPNGAVTQGTNLVILAAPDPATWGARFELRF